MVGALRALGHALFGAAVGGSVAFGGSCFTGFASFSTFSGRSFLVHRAGSARHALWRAHVGSLLDCRRSVATVVGVRTSVDGDERSNHEGDDRGQLDEDVHRRT